jgi:putative glycosyltransferase (TIGR04372 family)
MKRFPKLRLSSGEIEFRLAGRESGLSSQQFLLTKPLLAGPAEFVFAKVQRSKVRRFLRRLIFEYSPFKVRFAFTVMFRHLTGIAALDGLLITSSASKIRSDLDWVLNGSLAKLYPREVFLYLLMFGYQDAAFARFNPDDNASGGALEYSALLPKIHELDWEDVLTQELDLGVGSRETVSSVLKPAIEYRNFEYEEALIRQQADLHDVEGLPLERYVPAFFWDKKLVERLMSELELTQNDDQIDPPKHRIVEPARVDKEENSTEKEEKTVENDIKQFYAYRHLMLRTYHNGEGFRLPLIYQRTVEAQRRLRRSLPAPSASLKKLLNRIGVEFSEIRLLSPDWSALIGHNGHLNVHLMMRTMEWWRGSPVLLAYKERIANQPFLSLFKDICPTLTLGDNTPPNAWHELASLTPFLGDSHQAFAFADGRTMYWNDAGAMALNKWEVENRGLPLRDIYDHRLLTDESPNLLFQSLRQHWGMLPNDWHVCLHMRDAETRNETLGVGESIRSSSLDNYLDAIGYITQLGGWVIRMGGPKVPPLPPMHRVIDYARSDDRSPLMDIHLMRTARMFIGTTSGFAYVASSFGIPTAMVNALSSVGLLWSKDTRFALKPVHTVDRRMLSLRDVTSDRWRWTFPTYESLARAGLTVRDNSSDEILETVKEVLEVSHASETAGQTLDDSWQRCVMTPAFYGSARPGKYFLEKYSDSLLAGDSTERPTQ